MWMIDLGMMVMMMVVLRLRMMRYLMLVMMLNVGMVSLLVDAG
jgi:hypothetical protein